MVSLSDVCYEQIKDNFYYGLFGDFRLVIDKTTGCFNATKLCIQADKHFYHWSRLEKSKRFINYYNAKSCPPYVVGNFYEIKETNNDEIKKQITGQYVQKELILDIASWISVEFYDKCNQIIINYFVGEFKSMDKNEFETKIKDIEERMSDIILEKEDIIQEKNDKIDELLQLGRQQEERSKRQEEMLRSLGVHLEDVE
jgi:KilA-N domain